MTAILDNIANGKYGRKELETLLKNATKKGGHEDVIEACNLALAAMPKKASSGSRANPAGAIAEEKDGYAIMVSAYGKTGELLKPELMPIAKELAMHALVEDVAIMKTQIRLYLKGRHMTAGVASKGGYWFGLLDETKITDTTIELWEGIGEINRGIYFDTKYVNVRFDDLSDLHTAIDMVSFT